MGFEQYITVNNLINELTDPDRKLHVRIYLYPKISVLEIASIILDNIWTAKEIIIMTRD